MGVSGGIGWGEGSGVECGWVLKGGGVGGSWAGWELVWGGTGPGWGGQGGDISLRDENAGVPRSDVMPACGECTWDHSLRSQHTLAGSSVLTCERANPVGCSIPGVKAHESHASLCCLTEPSHKKRMVLRM